ncbi:hypothetical protein BH10ACI3_BH10ACI3_08700 [soil metagenome]
MQKNTVLFIIIALLAGFIVGFWLANSINRSALKAIAPQPDGPSANNLGGSTAGGPQDLSVEEIKAKIDEADKNPTNFAYQKDLGTALYKYASMKNAPMLLSESVRILERANSINGKDFDVLTALGNAHFDIGFAKKDNAEFQTARDIYTKALEIKPADADVQTDLGLTFFLQDPPALDKAASTLQKVSDANPKHERSLEFLIQTYIKQAKFAEAEKSIAKLKSVNPSSKAVPDLTSQFTNAQNGVK